MTHSLGFSPKEWVFYFSLFYPLIFSLASFIILFMVKDNSKIEKLIPGFISNDDIDSLNKLLRQLSTRAIEITSDQLEEIINQVNLELFIFRNDKNRIIATGTIYFEKQLMGLSARIEDIVVSDDYRKLGIGESLVRRLIEEARAKKTRNIELTSGLHREAANKLYPKLGFERVDTNVYRLRLDK